MDTTGLNRSMASGDAILQWKFPQCNVGEALRVLRTRMWVRFFAFWKLPFIVTSSTTAFVL